MVSLIRKYVKTRKLQISETMLKFSLCLLRLTSQSVVKPFATYGFAAPQFSGFDVFAKQRNQEKSAILVPESGFSSREGICHALRGLAAVGTLLMGNVRKL